MSDREIDQQLVERAQRGEKQAFELLVSKYQRKLARLLSRFIRDPTEVEDVTQEAFIKAYRALPTFRGDSAFYTWLYRIGINTAKNYLVALGRRAPTTTDIDSEEAEGFEDGEHLRDLNTPENEMMSRQVAETVNQTLEELPEELRTAITLREIEGLSYEDIANIMSTEATYLCEQVGVFTPKSRAKTELAAGEVGFVIAGIKELKAAQVGDTLTRADERAREALPGFKEIKPQVFAGLYPVDSNEYDALRDALEKLHLNDASLRYEPESSQALGFGFRCGFLGLLHMPNLNPEQLLATLEDEYRNVSEIIVHGAGKGNCTRSCAPNGTDRISLSAASRSSAASI